MVKLFFFDVETTGLSAYKCAMHQISGSIIIDGEVKEEFDIKLAPRADAVIEESALKVSNVTEEQIRAYQPPIEAYRQLVKMLAKYCDKFNKGDKFFLVGYNNKGFDNDFLRNFFKQNGDNYFGSWFWADSIDVMVLAANYLKDERHKLENFQLRTVAKYLDIKVDETKLHDAMYDIWLTRAIYEIVKNGKKPEGETPSRDSDLSERLATLNGEAMDKWHDAKTDPPEKTISYLCFMANGHMKVCFFTGAEWLDILQNTLEGVVTHWMARPPSPYATEAVETAIVEKAGEVIPLTETEAEAALRESGLLLETPIVK